MNPFVKRLEELGGSIYLEPLLKHQNSFIFNQIQEMIEKYY